MMNLILIAEDSPLNVKVLRLLLQKMDLDCDIASNGKEAVEAASRQRYAIILMDIMMPEVDGLDATRAIRQMEEETTGHHAAIIAVTSCEIDRQDCIDAGMDDLIRKPVDFAILQNRLAYWINEQMNALYA
jgi:CheY-like chemotaxis protein